MSKTRGGVLLLSRDAFHATLLSAACCALFLAEAGEDLRADTVKATQDLVKPKPKPAGDKPIEIVVTATKSEEPTYEVPFMTNVYKSSELTERLASVTNFVDAFKETPGVVVQKTSQGQGSPFIRGFTGYRNAVLIDGIRYNKSFMRDGPNQYWSALDPLSIQRLELIKGPGSVLYGSDAVGGTVNVLTKSTDTWGEGTKIGGSFYQAGNAGLNSSVSRAEVKGSHGDMVGFIFGSSAKYYDDYVAGDDTGTVENSGYSEYGFDGKVQYRPYKKHELTLVGQYFNQDAVPRTEQTRYSKAFAGTVVGQEYRHNNDQERILAYVRYAITDLGGALESLQLTFSYQNTKELLHRIRNDNSSGTRRRLEKNRFAVDTFGVQGQMVSAVPILGKFTYGFDWYKDLVDSSRTENVVNMLAGGVKQFRSSRPHAQGLVADDASYDLAGIYLQDEKTVLDGYLTLTAAGRFDYAQVDAGTIENLASPSSGFTLNSFSYYENWNALTGSFRFLARPDLKHGDHWHVFGGVSQAFRAPSLHDTTVVDSAGTFFETPATHLQPEHFITYEIGTKARYANVAFSAAYFYTWIDDLILRSPTGQRLGNATVIEKSNGGQGHVKGLEVEAQYLFMKDFKLWGNLTWTEGTLSQFEGDQNGSPPQFRIDKPFGGRLIPIVAHMGFRYQPVERHWWVELHADLADSADRLAVGERFDPRRIPPNGTPGYGVVGLRGAGKILNQKLTITGGIENLLNENYRTHGSGQNMPGLNAYLGLKFDW